MDQKWFVKSKTVWGAIVATAPIWLQTLGVDLSDANFELIAQWGNDALALVGSLLVLIGRFQANDGKKVTLAPAKKQNGGGLDPRRPRR